LQYEQLPENPPPQSETQERLDALLKSMHLRRTTVESPEFGGILDEQGAAPGEGSDADAPFNGGSTVGGTDRQLASVSAARSAAHLRRERRLGEPDEDDHHQEQDPEQVEDLVEPDLHRLLRDHLVEQ